MRTPFNIFLELKMISKSSTDTSIAHSYHVSNAGSILSQKYQSS